MEKLKEVLKLHKKWLNNEQDGIWADLRGINLRGIDLNGVDLRYADLSDTDLSCANLSEADLRYTNLSGANLSGANLRYANLCGANLNGANLNGVDLINANLNYANLSGADLSGVDLRYANLSCAYLSNANLSGIKYNCLSIGLNLVCPEEGSYIGYKKAKNEDKEEVIIKLLITEDSLRSSATTRKCRCSKAKVLSITSLDKTKSFDKAYSDWDKTFIYKVGEIVGVNDFNTNRWKDCAAGIHHFITEREAIEY